MTNLQRPFGAALTAMVTPFTDDGALDLATAARLAAYLVEHGNHGLVINGTTGEAATTSDAEKTELLRCAAGATAGQAYIVAGVGTNNTAHSVHLAREAAQAGAHGLLVVTPYYSRPSQEGLVQHYMRVADATDLPVIVYDIPGRTGVRIEDSTWDKLAAHQQIVAVKDAVGDVARAWRLQQRTGLAWYSGDDALNFALLAQGACGVISTVGHVTGQAWARLAQTIDAGDLPRARAIFGQVMPVIDAIMGGGQGAPMVKAALQVVGMCPNRTTRLPVFPATEPQVGEVREALINAGLYGGG
ncbi:MAG: 4-hydroxy-tetrahydrodipicolinate synthase [Bifidobacteriaceae bacterium]|jgi:4-hydroxy-tetrahydrodipicolinate synthase|nr:4-hydroxy-tetrahydrodipicolinate synthase [Bifidobacteriaceae bacterium]